MALSIISAGLLVAAQAPWSAGWLSTVALVPLLLALRDAPLRLRVALGWLCGSLWSLGLVGSWLWPAARSVLDGGPISAFFVVLGATQIYGALHVALFAALVGVPSIARRPLAIAAAWVAIELLRSPSFGGIPWGLLAHSLWNFPRLIQASAVVGVAGVSFWLAAVNAAIAEMITRRGEARSIAGPAALAAVIMAAVMAHGAWRLGTGEEAAQPSPLVVRVVHSDWPALDAMEGEALLHEMVATTWSLAAAAEIVLWPEAALRLLPTEYPEQANRLYRLAAELRSDLMFGGSRTDGGLLFNSVYRLQPKSTDVLAIYDKRRPVPLAEAHYSAGDAIATLRVGRQRTALVLLCFEAIFADLALGPRADFLFNPSNDVRVGAAAEQQAAMAVFRAVETGTPLLRVANAGPSILVDPYGRVLARAARGWGSEVWNLPAPLSDTVFHRSARWWLENVPRPISWRLAGDGVFAWVCLGFVLAAAARRGANRGSH